MTEVVIYTDGACSGNPGPGGWGVVMSCQGKEKEMYGFDPLTTNNRMELMAAIQALEALTRPVTVSLHTDSTYVLNGITKWIQGWQRNGWKTAAKKPVKNDDLWRRLTEAMRAFIAMYRPHEAREDTELFPQLRKVVSASEFDAMAEDFERAEHRKFGEDGFGTMVARVAALETALGISDLSRMTPA